MKDQEYEDLLKIIVDEATMMINDDERVKDDEDKFHDILFGNVITRVDEEGHLSHLEAIDISSACGDVEGDIFRGDILGL